MVQYCQCLAAAAKFDVLCLANRITISAKLVNTPLSRHFSSKGESKKLKITSSAPAMGKSDIYGPPDPISNIQTIRFYIPPDETPTEKKFRLQRAEVLDWNHKFWTDHNTKFFKEKGDFVKSIKSTGKDQSKKTTPAEQMSVFYRKFLNENRKDHLRYNKEWYKKNISLLWPAFLVFFIRLRRKLFTSNRKLP
ncbi:Apoptogenic protein 1, mitochondrial [Plakobranchus ocellatus]|uniref:Apoptogenic protein 1, mitochondrial n=1 Tax=Plakobranchus ocellatus TaxID=259542 RepID=A0AAV3YTY5_9GAST|nr:Apoptogenic protein 1, mitochondrial [Plakobranchus ocellatus]